MWEENDLESTDFKSRTRKYLHEYRIYRYREQKCSYHGIIHD